MTQLPDTTMSNEAIGRIDRIEAIQEQQAQSLRSLTGNMNELATEVRDGFQDIRKEVGKIGKTSWPLVATIIGLIVSATLGSVGLMITIGSMAISPIAQDIRDHTSLAGHPEAMELHAAYGERFKTIRAEIQAIREATRVNTDDLASRSGNRFNRSDWQRAEDVVIGPMKQDIEQMKSTRFTSSDGKLLMVDIARLQGRADALEARVDEFRQEQLRRTERVYQNAP